jgi:predicted signal transduction protein with EAL and GGDEF domain/DNA-binding response OmpR family regulator
MNPGFNLGSDSSDAHPRVLLVDDDEVNLLLTATALRERGFEITEVSGGEAALDQLSTQVPDLVVLDAMMPELDGFDTCRRLRALPGFEHMPVLMLTGLDDDSSISRAYQAGATDFFVKSNQWSLLAGRLRYLLRASRTRQELERSKTKLARAQDLARMGSFDWRPTPNGSSMGQLTMSPEGLRVFGFEADTPVSVRSLVRMVDPHERHGLLGLLFQVVEQSTVLTSDVPVFQQDYRRRIVHLEAEPEFNEHGTVVGYTGIVQDVTDRRQAEDRIRHLANFDSLTGLPNRRQLIWRTERALDHARRLRHQAALLLIDVDRFKVINDTLGHGAGDEMLCELARRLRSCVRHTDQPMDGSLESAGSRSHRSLEAVGRLGGDEFVALLPEVSDEQDAQRVAQRMLEAAREPLWVAGQECFATISVGISMFPRDGQNVADLMRNSDVAMYSVKSSGRNNSAIYTPMLSGRGREKLELESALHKALERNELVLHYQPKVDVRLARIDGVEALMRWQRGNTLVPPADFIPLAEETGLIVPMTRWAVGEAARQSRQWRDSFGFRDSIAVNAPNRMFEREDLIELVHEAVTEHGVEHHCIQLEITETGLMKDLETVMPSLHQLNDLGVEISVDDFGTGYSSLSYLTTLPISEVKIDRSFVHDLGITPQSSAVVSAIIALARSLGLRVVAEGVENLRQMEVLHRLGCTVMQGFLFNRPVPPDELETWVKEVVLPRKQPWLGDPDDQMRYGLAALRRPF